MTITRLLSTTALILALTVTGAQAQGAQDSGKKWAEMRQQHQDIMNELPPEKAKLYRDTMKAAYEKNKPVREQIEKLHAEAKAVLVADKFDKDAYLAKDAEIGKAFDQMHANVSQAFASIAGQYTLDERKTLAKLRHEPAKQEPAQSGAKPAGKQDAPK